MGSPHLRMKNSRLLMGQLRIKLECGYSHIPSLIFVISPGSQLGNFFDLNSSELETSHVSWFLLLVLLRAS